MSAVWREAADRVCFFATKPFFLRFSNEKFIKELISMKHIIRAFVVVLVLTGAVATTQTSSASTQNKVTAARTSMLPVPTCPPDDPNVCGMARGR
jgi:hypothetical protein